MLIFFWEFLGFCGNWRFSANGRVAQWIWVLNLLLCKCNCGGAPAGFWSSILVLGRYSLSLIFHIDSRHLAVFFFLFLELMSTFVLLQLRLTACRAGYTNYDVALVLRLDFKVAILVKWPLAKQLDSWRQKWVQEGSLLYQKAQTLLLRTFKTHATETWWEEGICGRGWTDGFPARRSWLFWFLIGVTHSSYI